ncbi:hypothetical protein LINPERHAP2_LOCUS2763, partial [Linum perenne]
PPPLLPSPSLLPHPFSSILLLRLLSLLLLPPPSPFSSSTSLLTCLLPSRKSSIKNLDINISILNVSPLFHFGTFCCRSKRFSTFVSMRKRSREGEEEGRRWKESRRRWKGGEQEGWRVRGGREEEGQRW